MKHMHIDSRYASHAMDKLFLECRIEVIIKIRNFVFISVLFCNVFWAKVKTVTLFWLGEAADWTYWVLGPFKSSER